MSKPGPACIFCGGRPCSKEHILSDWLTTAPELNGLFVKNLGGYDHLFDHGSASTDGQVVYDRRIERIEGDPLSRKVRRVCTRCNNVWMSQIETATKPILVPLILGQPATLSVEDQEKLAVWLTLKTLVAEFLDPDHVMATDDQRKTFYDLPQILPGWEIFVGRYSGSAGWRRYLHIAIGDMSAPGVIAAADDPVNGQVTTIILGEFFAYVASTNANVEQGFDTNLNAYLRRIAPIGGASIDWHRSEAIDHALANEISMAPTKAVRLHSGRNDSQFDVGT